MDKMKQIVNEALNAVKGASFDELTLSAIHSRNFAIRVAKSAICRENVITSLKSYGIGGALQQRQGYQQSQALDKEYLVGEIKRFHDELITQQPDKEYQRATPPSGSLKWMIKPVSCRDILTPEKVYPLVEKHVSKVRDRSLRVTGFIEIKELHQYEIHQAGFELETMDYGVGISFTVDKDEKATGVGKRYSPIADLSEIDTLIGEALHEATAGCIGNENPASFAPGNYTAILSPDCLLDILSTGLYYGFFDRRKIDEGRTYLNRARLNELAFPEDLQLSQKNSFTYGNGKTYGLPPLNHRRTHCDSMNLIESGRIKDLHTSAFWAQEKGYQETHSPGGGIITLDAKGSALESQYQGLDELIKGTERGVYIMDLWYLRMVAEMDGIITGMTRDGVYEIVDGKITRPLRNMRWHDNPIRMLQSISGLTTKKRVLGISALAGGAWSTLAYLPAVRIEGFHFSSETKF